jgi:probable DNA metabolism protein
MTFLLYDKTFTGLVTAIFECYERKLFAVRIVSSEDAVEGFCMSIPVVSDPVKAQRVLKGLAEKTSVQVVENFHACFLSEDDMREDILLLFCRYVFASKTDVSRDFSHEAVLQVEKISKKVYREKHRLEASLLFARMEDGLHFTEVEPQFDVLPLIGNHFKDKTWDDDWLIYDKKRAYGIYFEKTTRVLNEIVLNFTDNPSNRQREMFHAEEKIYQQLWKDYFQHVNIPARKNLKVHIRHVPIRYWKHLTEKIQL